MKNQDNTFPIPPIEIGKIDKHYSSHQDIKENHTLLSYIAHAFPLIQKSPLLPPYIHAYLGGKGYCLLGTNQEESKEFEFCETLLFKDVAKMNLKTDYGYANVWRLSFYDKEDKLLLKLTEEHPILVKSIEAIVTQKLYKKTKDKNIFFDTNNTMVVDYQDYKKEGIYFQNDDVYVVKNAQKHPIETSKISTKYGIIYFYFYFSGKKMSISFELESFTNSRLLLQRISEKFDLCLPLMLHARGEQEPSID